MGLSNRTILFATSNPHKVLEAQEILGPIDFDVQQLKFVHREIRSDDLEEVALEAVHAAFAECKKPVFVEDTGLFIDSLGGFPGTYSAWVAKKLGNSGILKLMQGVPKPIRKAAFRTCIAFYDGKATYTFFGECVGTISETTRGSDGFGYDPLFIPAGEESTFAERKDLKNKLSHRYSSLLKFSRYLNDKKE